MGLFGKILDPQVRVGFCRYVRLPLRPYAPWLLLLLQGFLAVQADTPPHPHMYVVRRGWHVDVGFDAESLVGPLGSLVGTFPGMRYVFFGFGDRRYLLSRRRGTPAMLVALWPGDALILTTALGAMPQAAFGSSHVVVLDATESQLAKAQEFISHSAAANDSLDLVAAGPYEGSVYLSSTDSYSAFHTCNTWAAEVLKAAGFHVRTRGVVFASQVWSMTKRVAAAQQATAPRDHGF